MWPWLSTILALSLCIPFAFAADEPTTSPTGAPAELGPAPAQEADRLWREAVIMAHEGRRDEAISRLRRLIARHPGSRHEIPAHRLLGKVYLEAGDAKQALPLLKDYVDTTRRMPDMAEGRILLDRAYLQLKRSTEALLLAAEIENLIRKDKTPAPLLLSEALLLKSKALAQLKRPDEARLALDAAQKTESEAAAKSISAPLPLRGELALTNLELKLSECSRLPSARKMAEEQVRSQMLRRGDCLLESLVAHEKSALARHQLSLDLADKAVTQAWLDYLKAAAHPPLPPPLKPVDRTGRELKLYFDELAQSLTREARRKLDEASRLTEGKESQAALHRSLKYLARSERNAD